MKTSFLIVCAIVLIGVVINCGPDKCSVASADGWRIGSMLMGGCDNHLR